MAAVRTPRGGAGQFALRLGGEGSADVTVLAGTAAGGSVYADVVSETGGLPVRKHLGPTRYEGFALPLGLIASGELFEWIAASWGPEAPERDGAVLALDGQMAVQREADFTAALITETTFPTLDAAVDEVGHVTIRVQPAATHLKAGSGTLSLIGAKQKLWRTPYFRLQIDGLDCKYVSRIESLTIRRDVEIQTAGNGEVTLVPGSVKFPDLRITLSLASAQTWFTWHEQFVVEGNNDEGFERSGALSFLAVDVKTELARIALDHLGIVRLEPVEDQPTRITADLYCEEMTLMPGGKL